MSAAVMTASSSVEAADCCCRAPTEVTSAASTRSAENGRDHPRMRLTLPPGASGAHGRSAPRPRPNVEPRAAAHVFLPLTRSRGRRRYWRRTLDYPFTLIELRLGADGKGD